jgi:hypothetical protein
VCQYPYLSIKWFFSHTLQPNTGCSPLAIMLFTLANMLFNLANKLFPLVNILFGLANVVVLSSHFVLFIVVTNVLLPKLYLTPDCHP